MKLISWNVNGLRAVLTKGFKESFENLDADIFCIQETKMQENQITEDITEVLKIDIHTGIVQRKKGYSGTAVFTKKSQ